MKKNKTMSPLILVGILISTALADVSHVLSGSANPPAYPVEVNSLAAPKSAFQTGNPNDFWWMASNSPLKDAYEYYKKCSSKGDCLPPTSSGGSGSANAASSADAEFGPIDVKKNPFLNGDYQSGKVIDGSISSSSSYASSSSSSGGCTACSSSAQSGGGVDAFHSGTKVDITNNPFLNGQFATAGNGEQVKTENGFLGVQPKKPGFATSHPLTNKKPFATSLPNSPQSFVLGGGEAEGVECRGYGFLCVAKNLCINGVVNKNGEGLIQVRSDVQYCDVNTEACCRLASAAKSPSLDILLPGGSGSPTLASSVNSLAISAGKSSVTGSPFKFSGGPGSSPGQIQVVLGQSLEDNPAVYHAGESGIKSSGTAKPVRDITSNANAAYSTVDYSNVHIGNDIRFASNLEVADGYLPPIGGPPTPSSNIPDLVAPEIITYKPSVPTTQRSCRPGTFLGPSGTCESPVTSNPYCPFGTIRQPDGSCEAPAISSTLRPCPPGTIQTALGTCVAQPTQPPPTQSPACPLGTVKTPSGSCVKPIPTPTPKTCPPGTFLTASGSCEGPKSPCQPGSISTPLGDCVPPSRPQSCPPGTIATDSGLCEAIVTPAPPCPFGTIKGANGFCESPRPSTPTPKSCPPGTFLTASGSCESPTSPKPSCPFGTIQTPNGDCSIPSSPRPICPSGTIQKYDGSCEQIRPPPTPLSCPPGTFLSISGSCESPTTPRQPCPPGAIESPAGRCEYPVVSSTTIGYEYSKPCPPGTIKTPAGTCEAPVATSPRPQCPIGTYLTPSGDCQTPTRPFSPLPPIESTTRTPEYLPPLTPTQPSTIQPNPADGYVYEQPTPTLAPFPSTPNSNNINNVAPLTTTLPPADLPSDGSNIRDVNILPRPSTPPPTDYNRPTTPDRNRPTRPTDTDNNVESGNINSVRTRPTTAQGPHQPSFNGEQNNEPPVGCAAALKCVQEIYCTADGSVSPVPVVLTKEQELLKVPTTVCKDLETGIIGKCCRDPNYKDPWPSANLVNGVDDGQYKEDNLYGQRDLVGSNRLVRASNITGSDSRPARNIDAARNSEPSCGGRNYNTQPIGDSSLDANFAEYPWQAMILRDSTRSLLCGGAIIRKNAVLTAAHCVEGQDTSDVLIKGGEWKLGIDEEPLPFQIVKVAAILRHPNYKAGSFDNDLAVLVLRENLRLTKNVGTICLPQPNQIPTTSCVATGWGKRILQLHAKGALMHHINVTVINPQECQETLEQKFQNTAFNANTLCGVSDHDQCKVDYGSALACSNNQGGYTLSGTYSWDTGCKQEGQIGGYVAPDVEWIESVVEKPIKQLKRMENEYLLKNRV